MGTDTKTGFYWVGTSNWAFTTNGIKSIDLGTTGIVTFINGIAVTVTATFSTSITVAATAQLSGVIQIGGTSAAQYFNCRLQPQSKGSSINVRLVPFGGNLLFIAGVNQAIPSVTALSTAGLSASTFYYVYAYMVSTTVTLEAVTTAPTADANYGHQIKTGDGTRTLVGAVYTTSGVAFASTDGQLQVMSYYNRRRQVSWTYFTADRTTGSSSGSTWPTSTFNELNSEIRCTYIAWNDEPVKFYHHAQIQVTTSLSYVYSGIAIDGNIAGLSTDSAGRWKGVTGGNITWFDVNFEHTLNDVTTPQTQNAIHTVTMMGSGTAATWYSDAGNAPGTGTDGACRIGVEVNQ